MVLGSTLSWGKLFSTLLELEFTMWYNQHFCACSLCMYLYLLISSNLDVPLVYPCPPHNTNTLIFVSTKIVRDIASF